MKVAKKLARLTLDISAEKHRRLKAAAALRGISIKDLLMNQPAIQELCAYGYDHTPNAETIASIAEAEKESGSRKKYSKIDDLMKDLNS